MENPEIPGCQPLYRGYPERRAAGSRSPNLITPITRGNSASCHSPHTQQRIPQKPVVPRPLGQMTSYFTLASRALLYLLHGSWAYSNEKPGVPTETPGCKTNPLTFEVIKGVVVICLWPATPADCFFTLFLYLTLSACLFIFVCESYFRIHDRLHLAPISTIKMTSIGCKASFQRSMAVSMGRI